MVPLFSLLIIFKYTKETTLFNRIIHETVYLPLCVPSGLRGIMGVPEFSRPVSLDPVDMKFRRALDLFANVVMNVLH